MQARFQHELGYPTVFPFPDVIKCDRACETNDLFPQFPVGNMYPSILLTKLMPHLTFYGVMCIYMGQNQYGFGNKRTNSHIRIIFNILWIHMI